MKNKKGWNNARRNGTYWLSVFFLLMVIFNIVEFWEIQRLPLLGNVLTGLRNGYERIIPLQVVQMQDTLLSLLTIQLIMVLVIYVFNYLCGFLPNINESEKPGAYRYLLKSVILVDVISGIILEVYAINSLKNFTQDFRITSVATWENLFLFGIGSWWYWRNVLGIKETARIDKLIKSGKNYEKEVWYCITNGEERISSFSRVRWYEKNCTPIVDDVDIAEIKGVERENFFYYLVVLDDRKELTSEYENIICKIALLPHSKLKVVILGTGMQFANIITFLKTLQNISIDQNLTIDDIGKISIQSFLCNNNSKKEKEHPLKLSESEIFRETYINIGSSSRLCVSFMKMIISSLDVLPAIYALFDFIDLQYRLSIAFVISPEYSKQISWIKSKSRVIGNIGIMSRMVEERIIVNNSKNDRWIISYQELFEKIINDNDLNLIKKYLSNYKKDLTKPVWETIIYLTYSLRNVLRGHGTFDKADAQDLYNVVFKLAVLNVHILDSNNIHLRTSMDILSESAEDGYYYVYGNIKDETERIVSPFLVATGNGNILVFNNWNKSKVEKAKGSIEYINYLDGTLILPEYKKLEL